MRARLPFSIRRFGRLVLAIAGGRTWSSATTLRMVFVAHLPLANVCPAQTPAMSFLRQFTSGGIESATAVAADQSGIYVAGMVPGMSPGRAGVRKYDSKGNELWTREFTVTREFSVPVPGGPQFVRAAADGTGVYLAEWTAQILRKYGQNGDELWTHSLEFRPLAGVVAGSAGIYVAGRDFPPGHPLPYSLQNAVYLRKYNAEGVELWTRRWGRPDVIDIPFALAQDATGVYVIGQGGARKYDANGTELWVRDLDIGRPVPSVIAEAQPAGFFVVGGGIRNNTFLRRYDADGNEVWTRPLATPNAVYLGGIATDSTGVYVSGTTDFASPAVPGQCRSGSGVDSFVRKYDLNGTELWTREFGTPDSAWASGVAVNAGGVYVAGRYEAASEGTFSVTAVPDRRAFIAGFEKTPRQIDPARPRIFFDCVVNAASYVGGGVSPGEIVTIFGSKIGPAEMVQSRAGDDGRLPATLAGTRVLFSGIAAPLLYVSDTQSSAIVPFAVADLATVEVQVEYGGPLSDPIRMPVLQSRPGIFTVDGSGRGQGAILNEDGRLNSASNPARAGSVISIFGTGGGERGAGVVDGAIVGTVVPKTNLPVSVLFDLNDDSGPGLGEVLYAGSSPGSPAGVFQVNVRVPANLRVTGDAVHFGLVVGSQRTMHQATLALR